MTTEPTELLTDTEHEAIALLGQFWNTIAPTINHAPDATELAGLVHNCQHFVMARAAARAYPDRYRL